MAADPSAYHLGIGRFDECCQERSFGFSLVGIGKKRRRVEEKSMLGLVVVVRNEGKACENI